jgi:hypothetical protein
MTPPVLVKRDERGRVLPGFTANPSGRPKVVAEARDMFREQGPAAFRKACELMEHSDPRIALAAAVEIMNRADGKPAVTVDTTVHKLDLNKLYLQAVQAANGIVDVTPADAPSLNSDDLNRPEDEAGQSVNIAGPIDW